MIIVTKAMRMEDVRRRAQALVAALESPLSTDDLSAGWTPEKAQRWRDYFSRMLKAIDKGTVLSDPEFTWTVRMPITMDYDGVRGGRLLDQVLDVAKVFDRLQWWWLYLFKQ